MKTITLSLLSAFFTVFNAFSQTTIKMEKQGSVYLVPCKVNGLDLNFIFDTGASDVSISLTEASFMIKNGYLSKDDIIGTEHYKIANGEITEGTKIVLKEIQFANLSLYNVEASIVHNIDAPLLLGQSVIRKLGKIQLDGNKLTIFNGSSQNYSYETSAKNSETAINKKRSSTSSSKNLKKFPTYTGTVKVFTYAPIFEKPDILNSEQIGYAQNNLVQIIKKVNNKYYHVKSGSTKGYIFVGMIKKTNNHE